MCFLCMCFFIIVIIMYNMVCMCVLECMRVSVELYDCAKSNPCIDHHYTTSSHSHAHRVLESKNADYSVGDLVEGYFGWTTHAIYEGKVKPGMPYEAIKLDTAIHTSPSTALGVLGLPG